jgi:hypothetical protein
MAPESTNDALGSHLESRQEAIEDALRAETTPAEETPAPEPEAEPEQAPLEAPAPTEGEPGALAEAEPGAAPPEAEFEFEGRRIPRGDALAILEFHEWARANPQHVAAISAVLEGRAQIVPLEQQPPEASAASPAAARASDEDELDPAVRRELEALRGEIGTLRSRTMEEERAQALGAIEQASRTFAARYSLAEADVLKVQDALGQLRILPSFVARLGGDRIRGTEEALEVAYLSMPEFREREVERRMKLHEESQRRQRKASKLSGSSGSVPRTPSAPRSEAEIDAAILAELEQAMRGE